MVCNDVCRLVLKSKMMLVQFKKPKTHRIQVVNLNSHNVYVNAVSFLILDSVSWYICMWLLCVWSLGTVIAHLFSISLTVWGVIYVCTANSAGWATRQSIRQKIEERAVITGIPDLASITNNLLTIWRTVITNQKWAVGARPIAWFYFFVSGWFDFWFKHVVCYMLCIRNVVVW